MVNQNSIELFQISLQENLAPKKIPTEMKATCDFLPELIHFEEIRPSVELNPEMKSRPTNALDSNWSCWASKGTSVKSHNPVSSD